MLRSKGLQCSGVAFDQPFTTFPAPLSPYRFRRVPDPTTDRSRAFDGRIVPLTYVNSRTHPGVMLMDGLQVVQDLRKI
jgi:hypothetical protein